MKIERPGSWLSATAALMAGLLLRLWFIGHLVRVAGDSITYGGIAKTWLQYGVYGLTGAGSVPGSIQIFPTLIRLPGYPMFLAACFRIFGIWNFHAVLLVQLAADLGTCCVVAVLAGRLFGRRGGLAVLWLAALCPFTANYVSAALTETLVLATIAVAFYGFVRWQDAGVGSNLWLWVTAAALAYSILLRPDEGLLSAAVVPAMLWRSLATRESRAHPLAAVRPVMVAAICIVLPLAPWTLRNWRTFHVFQPLSPLYANDPGEMLPLGFTRWYRTWAIDFASTDEVYWNLGGDRIEFASLPARAFDAGSQQKSEELRDHTATVLRDYNVTTMETPEIDAQFASLAAERIRAHPVLCYFGMPIARLLNMALRPRVEMMPIPLEWWRRPTPARQTAFASAYAALNFGYFAAAFAGLLRWSRWSWVAQDGRRFRELAFAMAGYLVLRSALLLTIDNSEPRYTLEFFPVLFVWAGALFSAQPTVREPVQTP